MFEVDFTISGYVAPEYTAWFKYMFNMTDAEVTAATTVTEGEVSVTYQYTEMNGPRTFDMAFMQVNSKTLYGGIDELGIICGCAVNTATLSYEMGAEMGFKFSVDGYGMVGYIQTSNLPSDPNVYLENIPAQVFSTGCLSKSTNGTTYVPVAQTDSASLTITNNIERRGNCGKNWASGYSMGILNFEIETSTYSVDPAKYTLALYGYGTASTTMAPTKMPYMIPYMKIKTDNSDTAASVVATKSLDVNIINASVTSMNKTVTSEASIMDEPAIRGQDVSITVMYPGTEAED